MTTIKVPVELRDRLAVRAKQERRTLAQVIAAAVDEAEEAAFWSAVARANAELTDDERERRVFDPTLMDGLDNEIDNDISRRNAW